VASRLLLVVHLSSEWMLERVRRDSSFAEKRESHPARLLIVRSERCQQESKSAPLSGSE